MNHFLQSEGASNYGDRAIDEVDVRSASGCRVDRRVFEAFYATIKESVVCPICGETFNKTASAYLRARRCPHCFDLIGELSDEGLPATAVESEVRKPQA